MLLLNAQDAPTICPVLALYHFIQKKYPSPFCFSLEFRCSMSISTQAHVGHQSASVLLPHNIRLIVFALVLTVQRLPGGYRCRDSANGLMEISYLQTIYPHTHTPPYKSINYSKSIIKQSAPCPFLCFICFFYGYRCI